MTDIFNPSNVSIDTYNRTGGGPATIQGQVEAQIYTSRRKWQRSPVNISFTITGTKTYIDTIYSTIKSYGGSTYFYFQDKYDVAIEDEAVGTGDDSRTIFYLDKKYPITGTLVVYNDGTSVSNYTVDYDNGKITFDTAPLIGEVITADYEFYRAFYFDVGENTTNDIIITAKSENVWSIPIKMKEKIV